MCNLYNNEPVKPKDPLQKWHTKKFMCAIEE